jgi:hypothetical protein
VKKKKVSLILNDREMYTAAYNYPLGSIYGIKVSFAGIGALDNIQLKDLATGVSFHDDFEH